MPARGPGGCLDPRSVEELLDTVDDVGIPQQQVVASSRSFDEARVRPPVRKCRRQIEIGVGVGRVMNYQKLRPREIGLCSRCEGRPRLPAESLNSPDGGIEPSMVRALPAVRRPAANRVCPTLAQAKPWCAGAGHRRP